MAEDYLGGYARVADLKGSVLSPLTRTEMMNVRERFRRWRHRAQRRRALRKEETSPLREFVYLDEVSVFSLISSRLGPGGYGSPPRPNRVH